MESEISGKIHSYDSDIEKANGASAAQPEAQDLHHRVKSSK